MSISGACNQQNKITRSKQKLKAEKSKNAKSNVWQAGLLYIRDKIVCGFRRLSQCGNICGTTGTIMMLTDSTLNKDKIMTKREHQKTQTCRCIVHITLSSFIVSLSIRFYNWKSL